MTRAEGKGFCSDRTGPMAERCGGSWERPSFPAAVAQVKAVLLQWIWDNQGTKDSAQKWNGITPFAHGCHKCPHSISAFLSALQPISCIKCPAFETPGQMQMVQSLNKYSLPMVLLGLKRKQFLPKSESRNLIDAGFSLTLKPGGIPSISPSLSLPISGMPISLHSSWGGVSYSSQVEWSWLTVHNCSAT